MITGPLAGSMKNVYITLIRGEVASTVDCNYEVLTPLANIISYPTTKKAAAGDEKTITCKVPRTQWVLPIDEDKLYCGETNFLIWTQFPDAASYQMEINLPSPDFAENNVSAPQFNKQVTPLTGYIEFEGLALLTLPLPKGADGLVLELRIFALDAVGKIIGESVSSDSCSIIIKD